MKKGTNSEADTDEKMENMVSGFDKLELYKAPHETDMDLQTRIKKQMRNVKKELHKAREFVFDFNEGSVK